MDHSNGQDDEIAIDPLEIPGIPFLQSLPAIAGRLRRAWLVEGTWRPTRQGWLLAVIAAVVVLAALKLAGVIWTSGPPAWEPALGARVQVTSPEQVTPGHGSPGAATTGALAALSAKDPTLICDYEYGSIPDCKEESSKVPGRQLPYKVSAKISYVAIDGTRALVGFTGKVCSEGGASQCIMNFDPAAIFSAGKTFEALWTQALNPASNGEYSLLPCVDVGGKWYVGSGPA
jgi:hypothetical protein